MTRSFPPLFLTWLPLGFPAAGWFALAAIPVAAIFLYRRRGRGVIVPSVFLWEQIGRPVDVRSTAALLRRIFSLAVQLLLVFLLVFALANPWPRPVAAGRCVIVLDVSATLQTREGATDRFTLARERALHALDGLGSGAEAAVLLAGVSPILAQPLTRDLAAVRAVLENARCQDVDGDLRAAIRAAAAFGAADTPCQVVVCSDFTGVDPAVEASAWSAPARLRFEPVGSDHPDAAITDLWTDVQPGPPPGLRVRLTALVAQRGMTGKSVPVRLEVDGATMGRSQVVLATEQTPVEFNFACAPGAAAKVQVEAGDMLATDDAAYAVLLPSSQIRVDLVTPVGGALEKALVADPAVDLHVVAPAAFDPATNASVVVFDGAPSGRLNAPGPVRGYLFVHGADPFGWARATGELLAGAVTHWAGDHPALDDLNPTRLTATRALSLSWRADLSPRPLLWADAVPLMTDLPAPGDPSVRCLYWQFDCGDPSVAQQSIFPLLLWNSIEYLRGPSSGSSTRHLTGRPLRLNEAAGLSVSGPEGAPVAFRVEATIPAALTITDTARQGIYTIERQGRRQALALNLFSSRGLRPVGGAPPQFPADSPSLNPSAPWWRRPFARIAWDSVLLGAAALMLIEWLLYHRKIVLVE